MSCPICECDQIKRLYRLCDNMKIMGASFPKTPAFVAKCEKCGLIFTDSEFTQENLLDYYRHGAVAPKYYDMFDEGDTREYYAHLQELIKDYATKDSVILDIAGAWGEFAFYLKEQGYENVTVLDPNENCIKYAGDNGIKTIQADSTDMSAIEDDSIDMIILNHSLEHILDVKGTMKEIRRIMKNNGYLFIEIPDIEGYEKEEAAPYNFLTYEHVLHMSMNDMENLANNYGLSIIDSGSYYKKVSNYPSIFAILQVGDYGDIRCSGTPEECMNRYLRKSERVLSEFIEPLRKSQESLILWGIGASTAILIESFAGCNVSMLVDRNPARQGLNFSIDEKIFEIKDPTEVNGGTIVILSIPYRDSIKKQIRDMGLSNKIVALK